MQVIDKKSLTRWNNLNVAFENYRKYLARKSKIELDYVDLLYISNFKGGNASIIEDDDSVNQKLQTYQVYFVGIEKQFRNKRLQDLSTAEVEMLIAKVVELMSLTASTTTAIKGFKDSYLSGLLHAHFPDLLPVLDRRILVNTGVAPQEAVIKSTGQIKKIANYYPKLIRWFRQSLCTRQQTLRELDREFFIYEINKPVITPD